LKSEAGPSFASSTLVSCFRGFALSILVLRRITPLDSPVAPAARGSSPIGSSPPLEISWFGWPVGITLTILPVLPRALIMKMLSLKLPPGLNVKLERAARKCGWSKSEVARAALEQFLKAERPFRHASWPAISWAVGKDRDCDGDQVD
jgi:hypothetical protein